MKQVQGEVRLAPLLLVALLAAMSMASAQTTFVESSAAKGILPNRVADHLGPIGGVLGADYDNDGDVDVFVPNERGYANQLYVNVGNGTFQEIAAQVGLEDTMERDRAALFFDYDGDNDMDLIISSDCRVANSPDPCPFPVRLRLYQQQNDGTFVDVSVAAGLDLSLTTTQAQHIGGIVAGDLNGDNYLDVLITTFVGVPYLFMNNADGTFTEIAGAAGLAPANLNHQSPIMGDFNSDGWLDLYIAIDSNTPNQLHVNRGRTSTGIPQFEEIGAAAGVDTAFNDMGVAIGDYDNDGLFDFYVTNIESSPTGELVKWNVLFRKLQDTPPLYEEVARDSGVASGYWGWGTTFFDMDNDRDLDIAESNGHQHGWPFGPSRLWENTMTASPVAFNEVAGACDFDDDSVSSGLIGFDHDYDGDIDVFQVSVYFPIPLTHRVNIFDNTAPTYPNYLIVKPRMSGANHWAIGSVVRATLADGTMMSRYITAGTSTLGQEPSEAHFGLGASTVVDKVEVIYPTGTRMELQQVSGNQIVTVTCTDANVGNSLKLARDNPSDVTLYWSASCAGNADEDYEILAGNFDNWGSPVTILASAGGNQTATIQPNPGNRFYLVETKPLD